MIKIKKAALYCRSARADDYAIESQRMKLAAYAEKEGFNNTAVYADNGVSGVTLNRPALLRLMSDIEAGMVNTVIVYDFSRFSRSAVETARFIEGVFPKYGVRFISVMDGFDSADNNDDESYMASAHPIRVILGLYEHYNPK